MPVAGGDYAAMRYILGNTYGVDGETTLGVPDLRGKSPIVGAEYYLCVERMFPRGGISPKDADDSGPNSLDMERGTLVGSMAKWIADE